jgi:hypothetical protein
MGLTPGLGLGIEGPAGTEVRPSTGAKVNSILGSSHLPRKNSGKKLKQEEAQHRFSRSENHIPGARSRRRTPDGRAVHGGHRKPPPCPLTVQARPLRAFVDTPPGDLTGRLISSPLGSRKKLRTTYKTSSYSKRFGLRLLDQIVPGDPGDWPCSACPVLHSGPIIKTW